jgi:diguanylate cyclase (GGDEF)-like protein
MNSPPPKLRCSVRTQLRRFSWLMAVVLLLTTATLLISQLYLQRNLEVLEQRLLPRWQTAQQLHSDARTLSAQAARMPLALSQGELDTVRMRVDAQLAMLDEDLASLQRQAASHAEVASLALALRQLRAAIERASEMAGERIALGWGHNPGPDASREADTLRRIERDLARLIDEDTLILGSYASSLTSDLDHLLAAQRQRLELLRWVQTLLILLAGGAIGMLLLAQSRLLERQLLQRIDNLRQTMSSGTVDQQLLHADGRGDELEAMQVALAHLLDRLTRQKRILERQASTDPLTGLANRRRVLEQLTHEIQRHRRHALPLSVLAIDVDHFKRINDTWGHAAGDQVLQSLARLLTLGVRKSDVVARYGGEEFLVVLPDTGSEGGRVVAEHLRQQVAELALAGAEEQPDAIRVSISIGIATLQGEESLQALIDRADNALYRAKHEGRNRICCGEALATAPRPASAPHCAQLPGQ